METRKYSLHRVSESKCLHATRKQASAIKRLATYRERNEHFGNLLNGMVGKDVFEYFLHADPVVTNTLFDVIKKVESDCKVGTRPRLPRQGYNRKRAKDSADAVLTCSRTRPFLFSKRGIVPNYDKGILVPAPKPLLEHDYCHLPGYCFFLQEPPNLQAKPWLDAPCDNTLTFDGGDTQFTEDPLTCSTSTSDGNNNGDPIEWFRSSNGHFIPPPYAWYTKHVESAVVLEREFVVPPLRPLPIPVPVVSCDYAYDYGSFTANEGPVGVLGRTADLPESDLILSCPGFVPENVQAEALKRGRKTAVQKKERKAVKTSSQVSVIEDFATPSSITNDSEMSESPQFPETLGLDSASLTKDRKRSRGGASATCAPHSTKKCRKSSAGPVYDFDPKNMAIPIRKVARRKDIPM